MSPERIVRKAYDTAGDIADNAIMRLVSRLAMIVALPVISWVAIEFDHMRLKQVAESAALTSIELRVQSNEQSLATKYSLTSSASDRDEQLRRDFQQDKDRDRIEARVINLEEYFRSPRSNN